MVDFKTLTENQKEWLIDALYTDATEHIEAAKNENLWAQGSLASGDMDQVEMHFANAMEHYKYITFLTDVIKNVGGDPDEALDR